MFKMNKRIIKRLKIKLQSDNKKIEDDLIRRDFTINAIALELTGNQPQLIDPFNGVIDIAKKIIK